MNIPNVLRRLLLLDERRCSLCLEPFLAGSAADAPFCPGCVNRLTEHHGPCCEKCGCRLNSPSMYCGECLQSPPPWLSLRLIGPYSHHLREAILRGKFHGDTALLSALGTLLGRLIRARPFARAPEAIVPIPLHPARLRERGFNQSLEIAKGMAGELGLPPSPHLLERVRDTPSQRTLKREGRIANLKDAFRGHPAVRGKHILLADDVMTTGSTLKIASNALLKAGAASVSAAVLARD